MRKKSILWEQISLAIIAIILIVINYKFNHTLHYYYKLPFPNVIGVVLISISLMLFIYAVHFKKGVFLLYTFAKVSLVLIPVTMLFVWWVFTKMFEGL